MRRIELEEGHVIGNEQGEAIYILKPGESVAILNAGDRILRRDDLLNPERLVPIKMRFGKINPKAVVDWGMKYPMILLLLPYVQYQTGKLVYRNGVTINRTNLSKAVGLSRSTVDRQLKGLMEEDVIKGVRNGRDTIFYINPYVVHIGSKVRQSLVDLFKDTKYRDNYERMLKKGRDDSDV